MRMHYLPQFLLKQFIDGDDGLWELNTTNGEAKRASIGNAGMQRHLYTIELETGYLQRIDGQASEIMLGKIVGQERIRLTQAERETFAEWLALLIIRNLKKSELARRFIDEAMEDPIGTLSLIRASID